MGLKRRSRLSLERPLASDEVAAVFASYPAEVRGNLLALRRLIFDVATVTNGVGEIEETLKWGQPAYLTSNRIGTTIRLGPGRSEGSYGLYVHCQSSVIGTVQALYGNAFRYQGSRAVVFQRADRWPINELRHVMTLALTYQQWKSDAM